MEIKVGDRVKVTKITTDDELELAHMVGREGTVNNITPELMYPVSVAFSREHGMGFMESELEVI